MTIDRRLVAGAMSLALLLAACGGSAATASPSAGANATATPNGQPTAAPTAAPTATGAGPDISLAPGAAADLERMLPDTIGTLTLKKQSFDGAAIAGAGSLFDSTKVDPVLSKYGKSVADVRLAIAQAIPTAANPMDFAVIVAIQLRGVPSAQFAADLYDTEIAAATKQSIGGKDVYVTTDSGISSMYYFKDDIAFFITGSLENATTILGKLP